MIYDAGNGICVKLIKRDTYLASASEMKCGCPKGQWWPYFIKY
jgi:hypothetical protein